MSKPTALSTPTTPKRRTRRNPLKAIRAKCLECCGGSPKEVRLCSDVDCPLHPFRSGQKPLLRRKKSVSRRNNPAHAQSAATGPKEIQLSLLPPSATP